MSSADLIRIARRRAGLTQAELAARLRRPRSNVARWETGAARPSFETLQEIVAACGLDLKASLFDEDVSNDDYIWQLLDLAPAERLRRQVAIVGRGPFDPVALLRELKVPFVLIGRLAANLRGSPVVPDEREVVVCPASAQALAAAADELGGERWRESAQRPGDFPLEVRAFQGAARWWLPRHDATLVAVERPRGTRGYDDLRRGATVEELAPGVAVPVADILDLVRMADASPDPQDKLELPTLRRAIALVHADGAGTPRPARIPVGLEELFAEHGITA